jgi:methionine transaminase
MHIQSKLPQVGTTIFTVMSQMANEYKAINLGQGFPDFPMPQALTALVYKAMQNGHNQYTHMNGHIPLREALANKYNTLYHSSIDAENITITPGGTYAIYTAFTTILQPGDEVIVFEPAYDSYIPNIEANGGIPILISLEYPNYNIPWHTVAASITAKTKAIIMNSPHNPTGVVLTETDIAELEKIVAQHQLFIISDEVYEHLIYNNLPHLSLLRYPSLFERTFACFSFGKTYHCTGWKLGYCIAPKALTQEFRKIHQFNAFSADTPKQVALAEYLHNADAYNNLGKELQVKRDYFREKMLQTVFTCIPSNGSYFECYSYHEITTETDFDLAVRLTKEYGVTAIPVSSFYKNQTDNQVLRFCFAKQQSTIDAAIERLVRFKG